MINENLGLSYNTRKALSVQLGEVAANEIATLLHKMATQIEELKRSKVNVTHLIPRPKEEDPLSAVDSETF